MAGESGAKLLCSLRRRSFLSSLRGKTWHSLGQFAASWLRALPADSSFLMPLPKHSKSITSVDFVGAPVLRNCEFGPEKRLYGVWKELNRRESSVGIPVESHWARRPVCNYSGVISGCTGFGADAVGGGRITSQSLWLSTVRGLHSSLRAEEEALDVNLVAAGGKKRRGRPRKTPLVKEHEPGLMELGKAEDAISSDKSSDPALQLLSSTSPPPEITVKGVKKRKGHSRENSIDKKPVSPELESSEDASIVAIGGVVSGDSTDGSFEMTAGSEAPVAKMKRGRPRKTSLKEDVKILNPCPGDGRAPDDATAKATTAAVEVLDYPILPPPPSTNGASEMASDATDDAVLRSDQEESLLPTSPPPEITVKETAIKRRNTWPEESLTKKTVAAPELGRSDDASIVASGGVADDATAVLPLSSTSRSINMSAGNEASLIKKQTGRPKKTPLREEGHTSLQDGRARDDASAKAMAAAVVVPDYSDPPPPSLTNSASETASGATAGGLDSDNLPNNEINRVSSAEGPLPQPLGADQEETSPPLILGESSGAAVAGGLPGVPPADIDVDELMREVESSRLEWLERRVGKKKGAVSEVNDDEVSTAAVPLEKQRSLTVGIVGPPNAGKSLLTNILVGRKVTAVSRKSNTTQREILGTYTRGDLQVLFYDTPGIAQHVFGHPLKQINRELVMEAWRRADECDVVLVVIDANRQLSTPDPRVERLMRRLAQVPSPEGHSKVLCLNKVDQVRDKSQLLKLAQDFGLLPGFDATFMVSGFQQSGIREIREYLNRKGVLRPWEEPAKPNMSPMAIQSLAMEVVREHLLDRLHEEIPYSIQHTPVRIVFPKDNSVLLVHDIIVQTMMHKMIVIGKKGDCIRHIGMRARLELEKILGRKVHLMLDVKLAKNHQHMQQPDASRSYIRHAHPLCSTGLP